MGEIALTKDADTLICALYKEYLKRTKNGAKSNQARSFGEAATIAKLMKNWSVADTADICRELHNAGLLNCFFVDNTVGESELTAKGIAYMEGCTGRRISSVINILERLRSFLPW